VCRAVKKLWYLWRFGIYLDGSLGTMFPVYGKGDFISVHRKGDFIDIVSHEKHAEIQRGTLRLVPCQFNHGIMVEYWDEDNYKIWRSLLTYNKIHRVIAAGDGVFERRAS
jgi:hypothetical protein